MTLPIAVMRKGARFRPAQARAHGQVRAHARGRSAGVALCLAVAGLLMSPDLRAEEVSNPPSATDLLTDVEMQSLGCTVAAAVAGAATVAAGGVALIAAEVGVGSAGTAVAVPVLVATMAGACSLGSLATPAVLWLSHKGTLLGSAVVGTVAKE